MLRTLSECVCSQRPSAGAAVERKGDGRVLKVVAVEVIQLVLLPTQLEVQAVAAVLQVKMVETAAQAL